MISYLDTSFLMKFYVLEADSQRAIDIATRNRIDPVISSLSEVEMASGLRSKALSTLAPDAAVAAYREFRRNAGRYRFAEIDGQVFGLARSLAEKYGATLHVRALDVLHVAAALNYGTAAFGTFDGRQASLAEATGLKLLR